MTAGDNRRKFPATPASAGGARRFVESVLTGPGEEAHVYTATLLVSELVSNAVLHSGTPVEVVVRSAGDRVRIEVHDGNPQLPVRKHYSSLSGTGRGLVLVERMAAAWGADTTPTGGKVVWFELDAASVPTFGLLDAEAL